MCNRWVVAIPFVVAAICLSLIALLVFRARRRCITDLKDDASSLQQQSTWSVARAGSSNAVEQPETPPNHQVTQPLALSPRMGVLLDIIVNEDSRDEKQGRRCFSGASSLESRLDVYDDDDSSVSTLQTTSAARILHDNWLRPEKKAVDREITVMTTVENTTPSHEFIEEQLSI